MSKLFFVSLFSNKPLQIFILIAIILLLANLLIGAMNPYLYIDYFNSKFALSIGGTLPVIASFCVAPFAQTLVKNLVKKNQHRLLYCSLELDILFYSELKQPMYGYIWQLLSFLYWDSIILW